MNAITTELIQSVEHLLRELPRHPRALAVDAALKRALTLSRDGPPPPPMSRDFEGNTEFVSRDGATVSRDGLPPPPPLGKISPTGGVMECVECAARRASDAARQRKRRAEVRASANGPSTEAMPVP
jgi:hypothetical protein